MTDRVTPISDAKRKVRAQPPPARKDDARPEVYVSTDEKRFNDRVAAELAKRPDLYVRNGQLVTVACDEQQHPRVHILTAPNLRELIADSVRIVAVKMVFGNETTVNAHPPDWCVRALKDRTEWPNARPLIAIAEAPFLRADGTVCQGAGYDIASQIYLHLTATFPPVPKSPTQDDARAALQQLLEPFADFPFASDADRMVPVALVLTLLARHAIAGAVPLALHDANTRGSGKTLAASTASVIALGYAAPLCTFTADPAEQEKVLASHALAATPLIIFDNTSVLSGDSLDRCLTAPDRVGLRILGKSEVPNLTWRTCIAATGNNVVIKGDTSRRVYRGRLESPLENPEDRADFAHHPLLPWVKSERTRLVTAAMTILRAHALAGRPSCRVPLWGSFEQWSAIVPAAIVWAGGVDPQLTRRELIEGSDDEHAALAVLLDRWPARVGDRISVSELQQRIENDHEIQTALDTLGPGKGPLSNKRIGNALKRVKGRVVDNERIVSVSDRHAKVALWSKVSAGSAGSAGSDPNPSRAHASVNQQRPESDPAIPAIPATHSQDDEPGAFDDLL